MYTYANEVLEPDNLKYEDIEAHPGRDALLTAVKDEARDKLGFFLGPLELFSELARRGNAEGKSKKPRCDERKQGT